MRETIFLEVSDVAQHNHSGQLAFRLKPSQVAHIDASFKDDFVVVIDPQQIAEIAAAVAKVLQDN